MTQGVKTILGTMSIGVTLYEEKAAEFLAYYLQRNYKELDTAHIYGNGNTERVLGTLDPKRFVFATKANPFFSKEGTAPIGSGSPRGGLRPENIEAQLNESLSRLNLDSIDLFYLHMPDHETPIEDTLRKVNELYQQGKFKSFGLSNYSAWQVAEICGICQANQWVQPTVYQGMYNGISRGVEPELFPCLRRFGIAFYAYNPLAGGLLTGRYSYSDDPDSGRFAGETSIGKMYRNRYWNKSLFDGLEELKAVSTQHQISMVQVALRWMYHHSQLRTEHGDAVILGASSLTQLQENLDAVEQGPLPDDVAQKFDDVNGSLAGFVPKYFR